MKKIYALILLFTITYTAHSQSWQRKNVIAGAMSSDVIKLPSGKLISINTDGVYSSSDNADTWTKASADMDADLATFTSDFDPDVLHLKNDTLYAYFRSNLYRSTNEGSTWTKIQINSLSPSYETTFAINGSSLLLTKFDFLNNLSTIYVSSNEGNSWLVADTITARINLFKVNNEVFVWGYYGSAWGTKTCLFTKLGANHKLQSQMTTGLPAGTDIRGLGIAGNNVVAMVPEYNQSSAIIATRLYAFNGTNWTYGTQFTENYSKLYNINGTCYHLFYNAPYFLKSKDGITWSKINSTKLFRYFSNIRTVNGGKSIATCRAGIFEIDTALQLSPKNNGLYSSYLGDMISFKQKLYINSSESGLYVSNDNGQTFNEVQISAERKGASMKGSANNLYLYNSYLINDDKIFTSTDGTSWDTLTMPSTNYTMRQVLCVSDNGIWIQFNEANVSVFRFYNDQTKNWTDVTSSVPANTNYFSSYSGANNEIIVVYNYYENNKKKTKLYSVKNNASLWKEISGKLDEVWYENTSIYNNEFYYLKNAYNKPDSLFKITNDSLVFQKEIKYGSYHFYTDNFYESFFYRGNEIYCLGWDSLQQNSITIIRSLNGGNTWEAMNNGLSEGTQIKSLYFGNPLLASTSKGLYEFGNGGVHVWNTKKTNYTIYPNPANDKITVLLNQGESALVKIYNLKGQMVYQENINPFNTQIKTNLLNDGYYIFEINNQNKKELHKILISH